jgi:hypothetical protein
MPLPQQAAINRAGDKPNSLLEDRPQASKNQSPSLDAVPSATPSGWRMIEDKMSNSSMPPNDKRVLMLGEITEGAAAVQIDSVRQCDKPANVVYDNNDDRDDWKPSIFTLFV